MLLSSSVRRTLVPVAIVLGWSGSAAYAQQAGGFAVEVPAVRNYIGAVVGAAPDYMGSDDYTAVAAPVGLIKFGQTERYAKLVATNLTVNVLNSRTWSLGPALNYRFPRKNVDDEAVDKMRDIDGTTEAGAFAGWTWTGTDDPRNKFSASVQVLADVGGEYGGFLVTASARYNKPLSRKLTLSVGAGTTYGSENYMETYFGVDANNASRSGLRQFSAGSGIRDVKFPVMAIWSFNPKWHLAGGVVYSRLVSDAADSPITDDRGSPDQLFAGVGVIYAW